MPGLKHHSPAAPAEVPSGSRGPQLRADAGPKSCPADCGAVWVLLPARRGAAEWPRKIQKSVRREACLPPNSILGLAALGLTISWERGRLSWLWQEAPRIAQLRGRSYFPARASHGPQGRSALVLPTGRGEQEGNATHPPTTRQTPLHLLPETRRPEWILKQDIHSVTDSRPEFLFLFFFFLPRTDQSCPIFLSKLQD